MPVPEQTGSSGLCQGCFADDDKTLSAVSDQIMIIGEAIKQIPDEMKKRHPDIPWMRQQGCGMFLSIPASKLMSS